MDSWRTLIYAVNYCYMILIYLKSTTGQSGIKENSYCETSRFSASCHDDEVILIQSAHYGRMEKDVCQISNLHLGCQSNKKDFMDNKCSGRRQCEFKIIDHKRELSEDSTCPFDMDQYLKVEYKCIKVVVPDTTRCLLNKDVAMTDESGYLASSMIEDNGVTRGCTYVIDIPPGRELKISMYNFATYRYRSMSSCTVVADIRHDGTSVHSVQLCRDIMQGEKLMDPMFSGRVHIKFLSSQALKTAGAFLLRFELAGCQDILDHKGNHLQRTGDRLTVKCNATGETRTLVCKDSAWLGSIKECPKPMVKDDFRHDFPVGILVIVAIGVALGVFLGGLLLILAAAYMRRKQKEKERKMMYMIPPHDNFEERDHMGHVTRNMGTDPNSNCAQCTLERATLTQDNSKDSRMHSFHSPSNIDGSIKDYSLFEKNTLHENKPYNQIIMSSTRTLQPLSSRSHINESPKCTP